MALDADHLPISVGRDPLFAGEGVAGCCFSISQKAVDAIADDGPEWKFYDASMVRQTLAKPCAIFEGLRRADHEDGYCYVSKPSLDSWKCAEELADQEKNNYVFCVYVRKDQGLVVFDWAWRMECPSKPCHPKDWERDFSRGKIWPQN